MEESIRRPQNIKNAIKNIAKIMNVMSLILRSCFTNVLGWNNKTLDTFCSLSKKTFQHNQKFRLVRMILHTIFYNKPEFLQSLLQGSLSYQLKKTQSSQN